MLIIGVERAADSRDPVQRAARHSARLGAAVEVLFEVTELDSELTLEQVWESIEAIVPRRQLRESLDAVSDMVPPPGADDDAEMRAPADRADRHGDAVPEDPDRGHHVRPPPGGRGRAGGDADASAAAGPAHEDHRR
jgi:hypothetical protein